MYTLSTFLWKAGLRLARNPPGCMQYSDACLSLNDQTDIDPYVQTGIYIEKL